MSAQDIINKYISFFEKRGHKRISNSPLVPIDDPTTLFTSSGMQPLVPYLLGEPHPEGTRLVDVQNCFRAVDIDEVGDNRHTTFFRMLGNWSLGDYFKQEEIPWLWEFLTGELKLPKDKLHITVFKGDENVPYDQEAYEIWHNLLTKEGVEPKIFSGDINKNWWSRSGTPDKMPLGEIGGGDTEVYYRFDEGEHNEGCKDNPVECECGKFVEIANSVFIEYQKTEEGFKKLSQKNVDFGGGVERLLQAVDGKSDMFQTSLFSPIISAIKTATNKDYENNKESMRIIADHLTAAVFLALNNVKPSNKEQGYIMRRLIRRAHDNLNALGSENGEKIIEAIVDQHNQTDQELKNSFERIKNTILEEETVYRRTLGEAKKMIDKKYPKPENKTMDNLMSPREISAEDAFLVYTSYGLSPTQIKSLGFSFNEQEFAEKMKEHANISRAGSTQKFSGGLADHSEQTIRGHTATHLLHQAIRDLLGTKVHQSGSNITAERVRFDYNFNRSLTEDEIKNLEQTINQKIKENLPVYFEFMPLKRAKEIGAIGLFDEKYSDKVKVYFIGGSKNPSANSGLPHNSYSVEFCGGPHVNFTLEVKSFKIIKQENIGNGLRRLYAKVG